MVVLTRLRWVLAGLFATAGCFDEGPAVDSSPGSTSSDGSASGTTGTTVSSSNATETASGSNTASEDTGPADSSSGSGGVPTCGDGVMEGDELCDDGNDTPADGCTHCLPSGTPLWVYTDGTDADDEGAEALMLRAEDLVVVGGIAPTGTDIDAWVQVIDFDGSAVTRATVDGEGYADRAFALTATDAGAFVVTGGLARAVPSGELWLGRFDADGALVDQTEAGSTPDFDLGLGLAPLPGGGLVVAGQDVTTDNDSDAWLIAFDGLGYVDEVRCDCGPLGVARRIISDDAGNMASLFFQDVAWHLLGFAGAIDAGTMPVWDQPLDDAIGEVALAQGPDGTLHVCAAIAGFNDIELWWGMFSPQGEMQQAASFDVGDGDQECQGVAARENGVVLAGTLDVGSGRKTSIVTAVDIGSAEAAYQAELSIEDADWTFVRAVAVDGDSVYVAGAFGTAEHETDAFVARLVH